jgi:hypothetical protein
VLSLILAVWLQNFHKTRCFYPLSVLQWPLVNKAGLFPKITHITPVWCELTCWGSRPPSWRRGPRGSSCSWCSRSALQAKPHTPNAHAWAQLDKNADQDPEKVKEGRGKGCELTRGEDLGGVRGVRAADGEAALLELRADLLLHRAATSRFLVCSRGPSG